ncbi:kinase-like protein [Macrolepiota fuliginosa MF-IS2]|uniref:Kinase-like protein n=1 Tax=Macrolepiota fuliginosa MF-IS2 TaxID=1400762 RepID=A0A9P6C247_9AGAR|nr:kinase-like protein [Macrolepiota fuliginosa MF-IS2]
MKPDSSLRVPSSIHDIPHQNLDGRIERVTALSHADHSGGYADIIIGRLKNADNTTTKVAIKILRVNNDPELIEKITERLRRETVVWVGLDHPNILKFLGLAFDYDRFGCPALISPYCDEGTIDDHLKKTPININTRLSIMKGVANGLQYLHKREIVHGDLKPANILMYKGRPLLCDFGRSKILTQRGFTTKPVGTVRYQAPEIFDGKPEDMQKPIDVYAFVLTSYMIWTNVMPFAELPSDASVILAVATREARPRYPTSNVPPGTDLVWKLFEDCWRTRAAERLTVNVVVERLAEINK